MAESGMAASVWSSGEVELQPPRSLNLADQQVDARFLDSRRDAAVATKDS
jgi:hypothetical protein